MDVFSERKVSSCLFSPASEVVQAGGHNHAAFHTIPNSVCKGMTVKYRNRGKKSGGKSSYRHVPHREKPPHLVARRNARERRRVEAVNEAFQRLRKRVTGEVKQKRLSKVRTLRVAIDYINKLQRMIMEHDQKVCDKQCRGNPRRERINQSEEADSLSFSAKSSNLPESGEIMFDFCNEEHNNVGYQTTNAREDDPYFPEYGSLGMKEISVLPDL
ncbi:achaete-scute complex protein T3-like [Saccostrea echinata]|uniref:achaete-scute complex protein T3-like n=1 Tax=Saccostrea echinata TaxID=191078 RepID=UPI002A8192B5|nr:achaete-scute complex protein T3-like [Saccostrea echinata]